MALRLRKDVQKASYYVWFLGAEEARGLRGARVLLPAIPHLIERSREQEPLKVTLQVSQKGMKIVSGASKHFITHSAITCSVQTDDIVACVLLLYNPTTKCPLHVHAYRCDSETTAQALHQFLQVLINRPENQKRFAELEARLGLQSMSVSTPTTTTRSLSSPDVLPSSGSGNSHKQLAAGDGHSSSNSKTPVRRFESSLGSDTGTSTRESECSEELAAAGSPALPKSSLYDSLAAELRAKLNGNGPPLLLPPRDYDTVHRSKGNLAATELRRCRNSLIVGDKIKKQQQQAATALTTRSRGSSGIGSDLAPSPERPIEHSSSDDEEWIPNAHHHLPVEPDVPPPFQPRKALQRQSSYPFKEHFDLPDGNADQPPSYLYPIARELDLEPQSLMRQQQQQPPPQHSYASPAVDPIDSSHIRRPAARSSSREKTGVISTTTATPAGNNINDEQDIRPIIIRPRTYDSRFKHVLDERSKYNDVPDDDLGASKVEHHRAHRAAPDKTPGKAQLERRYRTAEEVQPLKGYVGGRYDDDMDDGEASPQHADEIMMAGGSSPIHNYRYGEKAQGIAVRSPGKGFSGGDPFDYRENLTDREKYRESQKINQQGMYKDHLLQHHQPQQQHFDLDRSRVRKSYAEPHHQFQHEEKPSPSQGVRSSARRDSPAQHKTTKYGGGGVVDEPLQSHVSSGYRRSGAAHHQQHHESVEVADQLQQQLHHQHRGGGGAEPAKLSRSFKPEKLATAEYDATGGAAAVRNPYKEPDSLPYRESIEKMIKSPVMRYKSFESGGGGGVGDTSSSLREAAIRYHNLDEPDMMVQPKFHHHQQQHGGGEPMVSPRRRPMMDQHHQHQQRAGSPDTVCRVSPKDRFNNAKEKFEAMERDRNYAVHENRALQSLQQHPVRMPSEDLLLHQHRRSQSPPSRRAPHSHLQMAPPQHQRYSMADDVHAKNDWSSEEEQSLGHHQQQQQHHHHQQQPAQMAYARRTAGGHHHQHPAPDPYAANDSAGRGLGPAKSLGNLVRGYRHSYAEPPRHQQAPLPRNSGRVGLAAVNPF